MKAFAARTLFHFEAPAFAKQATGTIGFFNLFPIGDSVSTRLQKPVADFFANGEPLAAIKVILIGAANVAYQVVEP